MKRLSDDPLVRLQECRGEPVPPAGGEVEVLGYSVKGNRYAIRLTKAELVELYEGYTGDALIELVDRAHVTLLQAVCDALKVEYNRQLNEKVEAMRLRGVEFVRANDLQSRLAQATAIIDYLWLHTELDAIAKSDVDKFYAGSTGAEKAARAEMVRVANEPAVKVCECSFEPGNPRVVTQGGHFPACVQCGRRLKHEKSI